VDAGPEHCIGTLARSPWSGALESLGPEHQGPPLRRLRYLKPFNLLLQEI